MVCKYIMKNSSIRELVCVLKHPKTIQQMQWRNMTGKRWVFFPGNKHRRHFCCETSLMHMTVGKENRVSYLSYAFVGFRIAHECVTVTAAQIQTFLSSDREKKWRTIFFLASRHDFLLIYTFFSGRFYIFFKKYKRKLWSISLCSILVLIRRNKLFLRKK